MESFCPFKLHEMENFQTKKADAEKEGTEKVPL